MDLETIQNMWKKDSKINIDDLHNESLNIPVLHAKYHEIYNNIVLLKKKAEQQKKNIRHERYEYYSGKADPKVYQDDPFFGKKITSKETMTKYLDADTKLSEVSLKVEYYDVLINYLENIMKMLSNRTYQIKNSVDFLKFQSGLG